MKIKIILIFLVAFSFSAQASKEMERLNERMKWFDGKEHCTDFGVSSEMSFAGLDGYRRDSKVLKHRTEKKNPSNKYPQKSCFKLPEDYSAHLIERDECYARIALAPISMTKEQAQYLLSKLHQTAAYDIHGKLEHRYFDEAKIPFKANRSAWEELLKYRIKARSLPRDEKSAATDKYISMFAPILDQTLLNLKASKSALEIVSYGYVGCH